MKAYSQDLRARVVQAVDRGIGTQDEVAELFGVSRTFVKNLLRLRRERGCLDTRPHGGGHLPRINGELLELLRQRVADRPGATLEELRRHLAEHSNVHVSTATICRALQKIGASQKKSRRRVQDKYGDWTSDGAALARSHPSARREGAGSPQSHPQSG